MTEKMKGATSTDAVATAIAQHLHTAASLMTAKADLSGRLSAVDAEIIARLDLVLAKLDCPAVPLSAQLWTLTDIAHFLHRHVATVSQSMASLPTFPPAIRLPGRGARGKPLYKAIEVIAWADSYQEKRRK